MTKSCPPYLRTNVRSDDCRNAAPLFAADLTLDRERGGVESLPVCLDCNPRIDWWETRCVPRALSGSGSWARHQRAGFWCIRMATIPTVRRPRAEGAYDPFDEF